MKNTKPSFQPPFCPFEDCSMKDNPTLRFFWKFGRFRCEKNPRGTPRFKCKECQRTFSRSTFSIDYRKKIPHLHRQVFNGVLGCSSNSHLARVLGVSEGVVRKRITDLARYALLKSKVLEKGLTLQEPVVYDGFETFTYSQFDPCHINIAVGKNSLFNYYTCLSPLNRKGRMTKNQKKKLNQLEKKWGRYPTSAIREKTTFTFKNLLKLLEKGDHTTLHLFTDEHKQYKLSLHRDLKGAPIEHHTVSSKKFRGPKNPLFPVNHQDLLFRHQLAACKRETIAFCKNESSLMERATLLKIYKNYMRPAFFRAKGKGPKDKETSSPAMFLGLTDKIFDFNEFFKGRNPGRKSDLDSEETAIFNRKYPFSRRKAA